MAATTRLWRSSDRTAPTPIAPLGFVLNRMENGLAAPRCPPRVGFLPGSRGLCPDSDRSHATGVEAAFRSRQIAPPRSFADNAKDSEFAPGTGLNWCPWLPGSLAPSPSIYGAEWATASPKSGKRAGLLFIFEARSFRLKAVLRIFCPSAFPSNHCNRFVASVNSAFRTLPKGAGLLPFATSFRYS